MTRTTTKTEILAGRALVKELQRLYNAMPCGIGLEALIRHSTVIDGNLVVRAVIDSLRHMAEDPEIWDLFSGDGILWKDRTSQSVLLRYLDIASPPEDSAPGAASPPEDT